MTKAEQKAVVGMAVQGLAGGGRETAQHRADVSAVRDFPASRLSVETTTPSRWGGRPVGPGELAAAIAPRHALGGRQQDLVFAAALPLRSGQDCELLETLPPPVTRGLLRAPHPGAAWHEPPAGQSKAPVTREALAGYEKAQPGYRLQLDVTFLERIPGTQKRRYQFTAIDDCTRLRVLKVYDTLQSGDRDPLRR